jgi:hypothetical protein
MSTVVIKDDVVTMSLAEYEEMLEDQVFLNCLRNQGVDNWQGYEFAQEEFQEFRNQIG